jgi:hypothetical protein
MVMVQVLFGVMFAEVYYFLGSAHFQCSGTPRAEDWLAFPFAQLLQKVDILDAIGQLHDVLTQVRAEHGLTRGDILILDAILQLHLDRQGFHHRGALVGILLVLFNLINGLVILEVLGRVIRQVRKAMFGDVHKQMITYIIRILVFAAVVFAGGFLVFGIPLSLMILFSDLPPTPAERQRAYGALLFGAGLALGIPIFLIIERRYFSWRVSKYGHLGPLEEDENKEWKPTTPWAAIVQLGGCLLLVPCLLIACLGVVWTVVGFIRGFITHGPGPMATWAWTNILQVIDIGNVVEVFDLRPSVPSDWELVVPSLVVRGATSLVLSLVIAGAARWWTGSLDDKQEDRINPSLEGWRGLSAGAALAAMIVAGFAFCC